MKFRDFQLPQKIKWVEETDGYGKLSCEPFERGYGHTIGNSLRRTLLGSLEGAVITSININGVLQEYSSIKGIKEDVLEIIFNLKQLRFKLFTEQNQRIILDASGEKKVKGSDFKLNESINLLNPGIHIATLDENARLYMEAVVERGRGYSLASQRQEKAVAIGDIPIDAAFSPVRKVNYDVENARVGQATDYDKLILEVWTDTSVRPKESVAYATQILKKTLDTFDVPELEEVELGEGVAVEKEKEDEIKKLPVEELKLSTRIENSLQRTGINTIEDLLRRTSKDILKIEKLGKKSIEEINEKLDKINKEKGTNIALKS
jgi:DNA-directed RNA polymerase subunit alpha